MNITDNDWAIAKHCREVVQKQNSMTKGRGGRPRGEGPRKFDKHISEWTEEELRSLTSREVAMLPGAIINSSLIKQRMARGYGVKVAATQPKQTKAKRDTREWNRKG